MRSCRLPRPGHRGPPAAANVTARAAKPGRTTQGRVDPQAGAQGAAAPSRLRHNSHARRRPRERWNSARGGPSSPALPGSGGAHLSEPRAHLAPRAVSRPPRSPSCCSLPSCSRLPGCRFKDKERALLFPSQPESSAYGNNSTEQKARQARQMTLRRFR